MNSFNQFVALHMQHSPSRVGILFPHGSVLKTFKSRYAIPTITHIRRVHASGNSSKEGKSPVSFSSASPPSIYELFTTFPKGVKRLYGDVQTYFNIQDAANTKRNAWTQLSSKSTDSTTTKTIIPRRQQEQQSRLLRDLRKVLVPVTACAIPMIGNAFIVLVAFAPRWCLSHHFFSKEYARGLVSMEYRDRSKHFHQCVLDLISNRGNSNSEDTTTNTTNSDSNESATKELEYIFGNVLRAYNDLLSIYSNQSVSESDLPSFDLQQWDLSSHLIMDMHSLSRSQLVTIASTTSLYSPILWLLPSFYIQHRLTSVANEIYHDNKLLLKEGYHLEHCRNLTHDEVIDACRIRGMPCNTTVPLEDMRISLTVYLKLMEGMEKQVDLNDNASADRMRLFIFYFPAAVHVYQCHHDFATIGS